MERNRGVKIKSKGLKNRVAENIQYPCNIEGCPRNRFNLGRYCQYHALKYRCHGHPTPPHYSQYFYCLTNYVYSACQKIFDGNIHSHKGLAESFKRMKQDVFMSEMTKGNHTDYRWWLAFSYGKEERMFVSGCCAFANLVKTVSDFDFKTDKQFDYSLARSLMLCSYNEVHNNRRLVYGRAIRDTIKWVKPYRIMLLNMGTAAIHMLEHQEDHEEDCQVPLKIPIKPKTKNQKEINENAKSESENSE